MFFYVNVYNFNPPVCLGGLNRAENNEDNFSKKEIRQSRMEMLVKDYEVQLQVIDLVYIIAPVIK